MDEFKTWWVITKNGKTKEDTIEWQRNAINILSNFCGDVYCILMELRCTKRYTNYKSHPCWHLRQTQGVTCNLYYFYCHIRISRQSVKRCAVPIARSKLSVFVTPEGGWLCIDPIQQEAARF